MNSRFVALVVLLPGAAFADDDAFVNPVELAGHRALQRAIAQSDEPLAPFTTDGCSGGMSSAWQLVADSFPDFAEAHGGTPPWETCCVVHDDAYHAGGRETSAAAAYAARRVADDALRACVVEQGESDLANIAARYDAAEADVRQAYRIISEAMYGAVRLGGGPCSGLPWRWGYGSPQCVVLPRDLKSPEE